MIQIEEAPVQHQRIARLCVGVALLGVVLFAAGVEVSRFLPVALALACPLMMLFMMRGMHGGHGSPADDESAPSIGEGGRR